MRLKTLLNAVATAAICGAAVAGGDAILDPTAISKGPKHIATVAGLGAVAGVANLFRKKPKKKGEPE